MFSGDQVGTVLGTVAVSQSNGRQSATPRRTLAPVNATSVVRGVPEALSPDRAIEAVCHLFQTVYLNRQVVWGVSLCW